MRRVLAGLLTAFSMYSIFPVPKARWERENMRYALCFFPLVGAMIGGVVWLWHRAAVHLSAAPGFFAAVAALLPVLISGGIHMDGFMDTADSLSSYGDREKKLKILQDPHLGAFGALYGVGLLLMTFGLWQQVYATPEYLPLAALGYILSRCGSALSIALIPPAKQSGLVHLFADSGNKRAILWSAGLLGAGVLALGIRLFPLAGSVTAGAVLLHWLVHRRFCMRNYGGNTGDLAGFLLQMLELTILAVAAVGGMLS